MGKKQADKISHARNTQIAIVVILLLIWEILPRYGVVHPIILAPFTSVIMEGYLHYFNILRHLGTTLIEIVVAILIAWVIGLTIGLLVGTNKTLRELLVPLFSSLYAVPIVIIYPVLSVWLGLGLQAKYIFGGLYGCFPVLLNTIAGVQSIDTQYITVAKSMGASKFQTIIQIIFPLSLPGIISGIRLGAALAVIGVIVGEMLASSEGIGFLIEANRTIFNSAGVYLAILISIGIVAAIDRILFIIEKKTVYWR